MKINRQVTSVFFYITVVQFDHNFLFESASHRFVVIFFFVVDVFVDFRRKRF